MGETSSYVLKSFHEGIMTVPPVMVTETRQTRKVTTSDDLNFEILTRSVHVVLYYNNISNEEYGWFLPEWIKQTLGRSLSEYPLIAGRLRRGEDADGGFEIVSNDSGIRLVEATMPISLEGFLDLKNIQDVENEVVFWIDIDQHIPQFSPLFYIHVTNFQCGGYSIGISCSILLADILVNPNFFNKWVNNLNKIISEKSFSKPPLFFLPHLKTTRSPNSPSIPFTSSLTKNCAKTMIFNTNFEKSEECNKKWALLCIDEAKNKLGSKLENGFCLFINEPNSDEIKVEFLAKNWIEESQIMRNGNEKIVCGNWDDLGTKRVAFIEGNYPNCVSYWIGSNCSSNGIVVVMPSIDEFSGVKFILSIPIEKEI